MIGGTEYLFFPKRTGKYFLELMVSKVSLQGRVQVSEVQKGKGGWKSLSKMSELAIHGTHLDACEFSLQLLYRYLLTRDCHRNFCEGIMQRMSYIIDQIGGSGVWNWVLEGLVPLTQTSLKRRWCVWCNSVKREVKMTIPEGNFRGILEVLFLCCAATIEQKMSVWEY